MSKKRKEQTMRLQVTEGLSVAIIPNKAYEFLMPTDEVAKGFDITSDAIRLIKKRHPDELFEGKHFIQKTKNTSVTKRNSRTLSTNYTMWTKRGIVRLGFFIKSERAKLFRDWAEDLIIEQFERSEVVKLVDEASLIVGSQNKLASRIGITASILSHLRNNPELVSSENISRIETVCRHIIKHGVSLDIDTIRLLLDVDTKSTRLALFERLINV